MKKIDGADPVAQSADIVGDNIAQMKALFPEVFTDGKINFETLKQLLGGTVDEREEKYGLNWHGKRKARQLALTPSTGTLRPAPQESVDWDTTQNLMIEGDNLEVLKLLQKSYAGKIKLIYIDPPYNTGSDFVYPDDFKDNIKNYLELTSQIESGRKISSNTETSGRFHTDWLNMIYPRLKIARNLLQNDGVIFISIDDVEVSNLRLVCDEVFGAENFIAQLTWEGAGKNDARQIGVSHEYVAVYARLRSALPSTWELAKEGVEPILQEAARLKSEYGEDYGASSEALAAWYRANKSKPSFAHRRFRYVDANGVYKEDDPTAPGGRKFDLVHPKTKKTIPLRPNRGWAFDQETFDQLVGQGRISFIGEQNIMVRRYLHETDAHTPQSVFYQPARSASERLAKLMGAAVFDFPKDETILRQFIEMATKHDANGAIVLDFFAGSGTTAHAVFDQNLIDGGARRVILVQLPEPLDPSKAEQREAASFCSKHKLSLNIAELTKERLRRVGKSIQSANREYEGDLGFRVFKLNSSNIRVWDPDRNNIAETLEQSAEHLKTDRTEQDILFELLLKLGLDLTVPIETKTIAGKPVHSIGAGVLLACLSDKIGAKEVEQLALGISQWHKELAPAGETQMVFRDSAFADDVAKTNLTAILQQHGLETVRSL